MLQPLAHRQHRVAKPFFDGIERIPNSAACSGKLRCHFQRSATFAWRAGPESAPGRVSRASPVHTATRNCTGDEGGPFGFGDQVADPKPPQAAVAKSHGSEGCGNVGTMIPIGKVERGERKRTAAEASKAD